MGSPCDGALPPFLLSPYLPRTSAPRSCSGTAKLLHIFLYFPHPIFSSFLFIYFSSPFFFPGVHLGRPDVLPQTPPLEKISEVSTIPDPYFSPVIGETLQMLTTRLVLWPLSPCNLLISLFRSLRTSIICCFQRSLFVFCSSLDFCMFTFLRAHLQ